MLFGDTTTINEVEDDLAELTKDGAKVFGYEELSDRNVVNLLARVES